MIRVREETYLDLVALRDAVVRKGVAQLPAGVRVRVTSLGDAVDLAIRAARKVVGE